MKEGRNVGFRRFQQLRSYRDEIETRNLEEIVTGDEVIKVKMENNPSSVSAWILGGAIEGLSAETMCNFWIISERAINQIYSEVLMRRKGEGKWGSHGSLNDVRK